MYRRCQIVSVTGTRHAPTFIAETALYGQVSRGRPPTLLFYWRYFALVVVGPTVVSGIVVVGVCNRSQMRTSKCTCLIFGVSIGKDPARNAQKEFLIGQSSRSQATYRLTISGWLLVAHVG